MQVLIIDDSDYKVRDLESLLQECDCVSAWSIARCYQAAARQLRESPPALVLLDMTLPTSERADGEFEGRDRIYGGKDLLQEMEFEEIVTRVIIVTQFDHFGDPPHAVDLKTLCAQLKRRFPAYVEGAVYYSNVDSQWRAQLRSMIEQVKAAAK